ncbi:hypothetical protein GOP47_0012608 [Adiantum capillus-veneris]|uniref:Uncharacterized protein n=1 Tax=Adiantum capillus-veneris TaxID=13818 RepID=A0A9D4ZFV5_ADICA|nr:hypothetical protein GOP47_0012608 [Adiantum capillus-veneris]
MAHPLAPNNPNQQDAGEILLSGFTHMALQMEAQRRLLKPGSKPRRGKKGPKKQPQRGLGVAQLEKIRLEEQRRASQHVQQLAVLRQLHSSASPLFRSSSNASMQAPAASIIPQLEREINHANFMLNTQPTMSSSLAHLPCMDSISSSSFLLNNVSPGLNLTMRSPTVSMRPNATATPLELFPTQKFPATSLNKVIPDDIFPDKNWSLHRLRCENRGLLENVQSSLDLAYDHTKEGHNHSRLSYSLLHMRRNCVPIAELRNSGPTTQVPSRTASPSFSLDNRMVELSSFQNAMAASMSDQHQLVFPKRQAWDVAPQPGKELPIWAIPSPAHSKTSLEHAVHDRRSEDEFALTLRPPGSSSCSTSVKGNEEPTSRCQRGGLQNFLSLCVGGGGWEESVADASSSTPSPTTNTTATTTTSTTDEYTSPLKTCNLRQTNFFSPNSHLLNESHISLASTCEINLDLTLKL